ncbi:copper chaperone [Cytophagaceae bacterium ABcell3]|nr:copper chaperone [Cytophagaceae bacterium ABcell3]
MNILKFKTNIDNEKDLAKVSTALDKEELISKWKLDLESEENILSVSGEEITPDVIIKIFRETGYEAENLRIIAIGGHDL